MRKHATDGSVSASDWIGAVSGIFICAALLVAAAVTAMYTLQPLFGWLFGLDMVATP